MTEARQAGWREALTEITTRRTVLGASVVGAAGLLNLAPDADAKNKKKRKKRCKNGAKRCGKKGCCKSPSVCSAASCFCTGSEGKCKSIPDELIELIAEALGIPPEQIGANPDEPLAQCPEIQEQLKSEINFNVNKEFGITGPVPWCEGGINAGVETLLDRLKEKA